MRRTSYLIDGSAALAFLSLFSQCAGKVNNVATPAVSGNADVTPGLEIAYVEVDMLLSQYGLCKDLNTDITSKEKNSRIVPNQKTSEPYKSQQEFQGRYESGAPISSKRA